MSRSSRLLDLFVEPPGPVDADPAPDTAPPLAARLPEATPALEPAPAPGRAPAAAPAVTRGAVPALGAAATPAPTRGGGRAVAVLAGPARAPHATAGVALALARTCGSRCALVRLVGAAAPSAGSSSRLPAARRAAARLRRDGHVAIAVGRLVWLGEPEVPDADALALASAELLQLAEALGVPAALGVAVSRSVELDRALARYDGLVAVRAPDAAQELGDLVLGSLRTLGPPLVALPAPGRLAGALATSGLHVPPAALAATRQLFGADE